MTLEPSPMREGYTSQPSMSRTNQGVSLKRSELFRLLADNYPGDILLIEQVDRLSRLNAEDWEKRKAEIQARKIRVVTLD